ncbi:phage integrase family protein [Mycobacterium intracellulare]|nr:phage integrase family protein [Mycobacterium intracellulare]
MTTVALDSQLQGYLDHLTIERGVAANTLSSYRRDLRRYTKHLSDRGIHDLAKVGENDVSEFLVALRRGDPETGAAALSAVSAARALIAVRGLHRFAAAEGLAELDVARAVRPPTPGRRLPKSLTVDQVLALLEGAGGDSPADGPLTLRNRALLELLYSTGARISEAVGLDVDDVDTQARSVLLRGKGGKQRLVPIGRPPWPRWTPIWCADVRIWRDGAAGRRPSSSTCAAGGCRVRARGRSCRTRPSARASPRGCRRTCCGTRSPRICSRAAPTCGSCRSCSGTPR